MDSLKNINKQDFIKALEDRRIFEEKHILAFCVILYYNKQEINPDNELLKNFIGKGFRYDLLADNLDTAGYDIDLAKRKERSKLFNYTKAWEVFFYEGVPFKFKGFVLREELKEALIEGGHYHQNLHEIIKKAKSQATPALNIIYKEGGVSFKNIKKYERNRKAREACLTAHGFICKACNLDMEKIYGEAGANCIEVHHFKLISSEKKQYNVDPKTDLIPLCPNCHRIAHRRTPPYTIDEIKEMIEKAKLID